MSNSFLVIDSNTGLSPKATDFVASTTLAFSALASTTTSGVANTFSTSFLAKSILNFVLPWLGLGP